VSLTASQALKQTIEVNAIIVKPTFTVIYKSPFKEINDPKMLWLQRFSAIKYVEEIVQLLYNNRKGQQVITPLPKTSTKGKIQCTPKKEYIIVVQFVIERR
jgi:hypothetical protein